MYKDEIISEVWRIRDAYAAENHHNLKEMLADLQKRELHPHSILVDRRPGHSPEGAAEADNLTHQAKGKAETNETRARRHRKTKAKAARR
jgi:hypothetical protein